GADVVRATESHRSAADRHHVRRKGRVDCRATSVARRRHKGHPRMILWCREISVVAGFTGELGGAPAHRDDGYPRLAAGVRDCATTDAVGNHIAEEIVV